VLGKQSQSALLSKAAGEVTYRFRMDVRFLGSLRRCAMFHEDHWTNQLIAPLDMIDTAELELVNIGHGVHRRCAPLLQTMVGCSQSGERVRGSPRVSPQVALRAGGVLTCGGKPRAVIVAKCGEGHHGEAAGIATAQA
jgi:hypothetical protein